MCTRCLDATRGDAIDGDGADHHVVAQLTFRIDQRAVDEIRNCLRSALKSALSNDLVEIGEKRLIGEIIRLEGDTATIQVYEDNTGMRIGERAVSLERPLSVHLGPGLLGQIYDGIQRPLREIKKTSGGYIAPGIKIDPIDTARRWPFAPSATVGAEAGPGTVLGTVQETQTVLFPEGRNGIPVRRACRITAEATGPGDTKPIGRLHLVSAIERLKTHWMGSSGIQDVEDHSARNLTGLARHGNRLRATLRTVKPGLIIDLPRSLPPRPLPAQTPAGSSHARTKNRPPRRPRVRSAPGVDCPDPVCGDALIRREQFQPFRLGLGDQHAVERITVQRRQRPRLFAVEEGYRQFCETFLLDDRVDVGGRFEFAERAWVEVTDASRQLLHSGENPSGTQLVVTGKPPFEIVIGNASKVKLTYGDKAVELAPYMRAEVARLTLE